MSGCDRATLEQGRSRVLRGRRGVRLGLSGRLRAMSIVPPASSVTADDVAAWLTELGLVPLERADREGVTSWDLVLDGRRRAALRVTLILDPSLALICWAHFAPPINDSFRKSYRKLLRWNDELPFIKFVVSEDERPVLVAEIPAALAERDALGVALARQLAVADRFHAEAGEWLKAGAWSMDPPPAARRNGPGVRLMVRYAGELAELVGDEADADAGVGGAEGADAGTPDAGTPDAGTRAASEPFVS